MLPGAWRWEWALWRLGVVGRGWAEAGGICQDPRVWAGCDCPGRQPENCFSQPPPATGRRKKRNNNKNNHQIFFFFFLNLPLMADWLYIIKQAAGDLPGKGA